MKKKQDAWEVSLSDDSWYRAPTFSPEGNQARRTDIEALCEIIYAYGERYEDGTAAIGFTWLFKVKIDRNDFLFDIFAFLRCLIELILWGFSSRQKNTDLYFLTEK